MVEFHRVRSNGRQRLGRTFKQIREDAGWSVREVAACLRRDPSVVTRIEAGKLALTEDHLVNLRRELGVSIDDLIDRASPPSPFLEREERLNAQGLWRALTPRGRQDRLFALTMERQVREARSCVHAGEEFISVLSGSVVVSLGPAQHRVDSTSTGLRIPPFQSHAVRLSSDCDRSELLWTVSAEGEGWHMPIEGPTFEWTCLAETNPLDAETDGTDEAAASHTLEV